MRLRRPSAELPAAPDPEASRLAKPWLDPERPRFGLLLGLGAALLVIAPELGLEIGTSGLMSASTGALVWLIWTLYNRPARRRARRRERIERAARSLGDAARCDEETLAIELAPLEGDRDFAETPLHEAAHGDMHDRLSRAHRELGQGLDDGCLRVPIADWPERPFDIETRVDDVLDAARWLASAPEPRVAWLYAMAVGRHSEAATAVEALMRLRAAYPDDPATEAATAALCESPRAEVRGSTACALLDPDRLRACLHDPEVLDWLDGDLALQLTAAAVEAGVATPAELMGSPDPQIERAALLLYPDRLDDAALLERIAGAQTREALGILFAVATARAPGVRRAAARTVLAEHPSESLTDGWWAILRQRGIDRRPPLGAAIATLGEHGTAEDLHALSALRRSQFAAQAEQARTTLIDRLGLAGGSGRLAMVESGGGGLALTPAEEPEAAGGLAVIEGAAPRADAPSPDGDRLSRLRERSADATSASTTAIASEPTGRHGRR